MCPAPELRLRLACGAPVGVDRGSVLIVDHGM